MAKVRGEVLNDKTGEVRDPNLEYPDPTPVALPVGFRRPPTLAETVRKLVRSEELRRAAEVAGFESAEEADDFDVDDDTYDPKSPYERHFDPDVKDRSNGAVEEVPVKVEAVAKVAPEAQKGV